MARGSVISRAVEPDTVEEEVWDNEIAAEESAAPPPRRSPSRERPVATATALVPGAKPVTGTIALNDREARLAAMQARVTSNAGLEVKVTNHILSLPTGAALKEFRAVILDFRVVNTYYENAYKQGVVEAPVCWAIAPDTKLLAPSENAPKPQSETGDCAGCWANQFKSAANQRGKACANKVKLALLPEDAKEGDPIWTLYIPATSINNFATASKAVAGVLGKLWHEVSIVIKDPGTKDYKQIQLTDPEVLTEDDAAFFESRVAEAQEVLDKEPELPEETAPPPPPPRGRPVVNRPGARV
jgi:hypothetical protein